MPERPVPTITPRTKPFWTGGAHGELLIARCQNCGLWLHPPLPLCSRCHSHEIAPEAVSGRGSVWSYTVNRYEWSPALPSPYVIAEIELAEQPGLRLMSTVVDCDDVTIGMPVRVRFEAAGDAWIPVFAP